MTDAFDTQFYLYRVVKLSPDDPALPAGNDVLGGSCFDNSQEFDTVERDVEEPTVV